MAEHVGKVLPFAGSWEVMLSVGEQRARVVYGMRPYLTVVMIENTDKKQPFTRYDYPVFKGLPERNSPPKAVAAAIKRMLKRIEGREWAHVIADLMPVFAPYWREGLSSLVVQPLPQDDCLWSVSFDVSSAATLAYTVRQTANGGAVEIAMGNRGVVEYHTSHKYLLAAILDEHKYNLHRITEFDIRDHA